MRRTQAGLLGYRVVITTAGAAEEEMKLLAGRGAEVHRVVTAGASTVRAEQELAAGLATLVRVGAQRRVVVGVSTAIALQAWLRAAAALDCCPRVLAALERAEVIVTPAAEAAARSAGLDPAVVTTGDGPLALAAALAGRDGPLLFLARHTTGPSSPAQQLRRAGRRVIELPVPLPGHGAGVATDAEVDGLARAMARRAVDGVSLTSVAGLDRLLERARDAGGLDAVLDAAEHCVSVTAANHSVAHAARAWGLHIEGAAGSSGARARAGALTRAVVLRRRLLCAEPLSVVVQGQVVIVDGTALWMSGPARRVVEAVATGGGSPVALAALAQAAAGNEFHPSAGAAALSAAVAEAAEHLAAAGAALVPRGPGVVLGRRRA